MFRKLIIMDDLPILVSDTGVVQTFDKDGIRKNGRRDNRKGVVLKPAMDKYGYFRYTFSNKDKRKSHYAHQLVALAYIPNLENKPTVNHKNGIKTDNRVENLEWATQKEQKAHSIKYKLCEKNIQALKDSNGRKSIAVFFDGVLYESINSAKRATGYHGATIKKYGQIKGVM